MAQHVTLFKRALKLTNPDPVNLVPLKPNVTSSHVSKTRFYLQIILLFRTHISVCCVISCALGMNVIEKDDIEIEILIKEA